MRISAGLTAVLFCLATSHAFCQATPGTVVFQQTAPEISTYGSFLDDVVASLRFPNSDAALKPSKLKIQDVIGLTEKEIQILNVVARDYQSKNQAFLEAVRPLKMEALLEMLDSGQVSEALARRIADLQNEQAEMILSQVQRLQAGFGASRFQVIETFIRSAHL